MLMPNMVTSMPPLMRSRSGWRNKSKGDFLLGLLPLLLDDDDDDGGGGCSSGGGGGDVLSNIAPPVDRLDETAEDLADPLPPAELIRLI